MSASQDVGSLAQEPWHLDEPYPGMSCQSLVEQHPATSTSTYNIKNWNAPPQSLQVTPGPQVYLEKSSESAAAKNMLNVRHLTNRTRQSPSQQCP